MNKRENTYTKAFVQSRYPGATCKRDVEGWKVLDGNDCPITDGHSKASDAWAQAAADLRRVAYRE